MGKNRSHRAAKKLERTELAASRRAEELKAALEERFPDGAPVLRKKKEPVTTPHTAVKPKKAKTAVSSRLLQRSSGAPFVQQGETAVAPRQPSPPAPVDSTVAAADDPGPEAMTEELQCCTCKGSVPIDRLLQHVQEPHPDCFASVLSVPCPFCGTGLLSEDVALHLALTHATAVAGVARCVPCRSDVPRARLFQHIAEIHPERIEHGTTNRCLYCQVVKLPLEWLIQHLAAEHLAHDAIRHCSEAGLTFYRPSDFAVNASGSTSPNKPKKAKSPTKTRKVTKAMRAKLALGKGALKCNVCHEQVKQSNLFGHVHESTGRVIPRSFLRCHYCAARVQDGEWAEHLATVHKAADARDAVASAERKRKTARLAATQLDPRILIHNPLDRSSTGREGTCSECLMRHIGLVAFYSTNKGTVALCKWCRPIVLKRSGIETKSSEPRFIQGGSPGSGKRHK